MKRKVWYWFFFIAVFLLLSAAVMFLWNLLLTQIVHVSIISYWQALGLMILCRILFGNFAFNGICSSLDSHRPKHYLKDKLMSMDETDRKMFMEEWRKRRGH